VKIEYKLQDISIEWDHAKASTNFKKHGVSFETACETFFDPFLVTAEGGVEQGEIRDALIGMTVDWKLLLVVYVMRDDIVRIVSARPVTNPERKQYENQ
jgi:uncharacterized protein